MSFSPELVYIGLFGAGVLLAYYSGILSGKIANTYIAIGGIGLMIVGTIGLLRRNNKRLTRYGV